jgi:hypothetical protein
MWSRSSGEIRWSTSTASSPRPICTQLRHRGCACSVTSQETPGRISLSTRQLKLRHPPEGTPGCARTTATDQQPHRRIAGVGAPQWRWSRRRPSIVSMETISVQGSRFRRPAAMLGSATRASLDSATRCALGQHTSGSAPPVRLAASRAADGQVQAWAPTTVAQATATELDFVSLPDALELVLLLVDDPRKFRKAALRWHAPLLWRGPGRRVRGGARRARVPGRPGGRTTEASGGRAG